VREGSFSSSVICLKVEVPGGGNVTVTIQSLESF